MSFYLDSSSKYNLSFKKQFCLFVCLFLTSETSKKLEYTLKQSEIRPNGPNVDIPKPTAVAIHSHFWSSRCIKMSGTCTFDHAMTLGDSRDDGTKPAL